MVALDQSGEYQGGVRANPAHYLAAPDDGSAENSGRSLFYLTLSHNRVSRKRSALPITDTELKLIAAAATIGLSNTPKAG